MNIVLADELVAEMRAGRWAEVVSIYERDLVREEKDAPEFRLAYAIALIRTGRISSGLRILELCEDFVGSAREELRRWVVRPFVDAGDHLRAIRVLDILLRGSQFASDLRLRASLLGRTKQWDAAIADVGLLLEGNPNDRVANTQMVQLLLQSGRVSEAGRFALAIKSFAESDPRLALMVLLALSRSGRSIDAVKLARRITEVAASDRQLAAAVIGTLVEAGEYSQAVDDAERFIADGQESADLYLALAEAILSQFRDDRFDRAIVQLRRGLEIEPQHAGLASALGEVLLRIRSYREAAEVLRKACEQNPKAAHTRALYARALKQCRRFNEAAVEFKRLLKLEPSSDRWKRYAAGALSQAGRPREAQDIFDAFVAERRASLPESFATGLDELWEKAGHATIPQARLDWAWGLREETAKDDRQEWERRAKWGHMADHYLLDWLECREERLHEAMKALAELGTAERVLAATDRSNGLILASAHIGPMYAGPLALELLGVPCRWLASTPSVAKTAYATSLISTSDQDDIQIARSFMRALKEKFSVIIAIDGAINLGAPRILFEGQEITYSSFAARTAHRMKVPSLFAAPKWVGGRIDFILREMPHPNLTSDPDQYADLWRTEFLNHLRAYLAGPAENLRLSGGIWRHIR